MSCNLPQEVMEEILLRCSLKCLVTYKRVCKSWYALITDSSFARKHLRISAGSYKHPCPVNLLMTSVMIRILNDRPSANRLNSRLRICSDDGGGGGGGILPSVFEEMEFPGIQTSELGFATHVVSSQCDGIVCLFSDQRFGKSDHSILVNPALGEFKLVCRPSVTPKFLASGCGFGYDSRANDYKYVEIQLRDPCRAMVYTLGSGCWKEIKIDLPYDFAIYAEGVYREGVYYWNGFKVSDHKHFVLSFDISEEVFGTIALPDDVSTDIGSISLALWNEKVAFFFLPHEWFSMPFEMWVMVENFGGVEGFTFWTKHVTVKPPESVHFDYSLAFWKDDELLMGTGDGTIISFNISTQKIRELDIPGLLQNLKADAHLYTPSLVSVRTRNGANRP